MPFNLSTLEIEVLEVALIHTISLTKSIGTFSFSGRMSYIIWYRWWDGNLSCCVTANVDSEDLVPTLKSQGKGQNLTAVGRATYCCGTTLAVLMILRNTN